MQMRTPLRVILVGVLALSALAGCTIFTPPRAVLQFSPASLPDATVGTAYTADIAVTQTETPVGGTSVESGSLPTGLDAALVDGTPNTVRIAGTPKTAGTYTFTISVWCYGTNVSGQTGSRQYVLVVK